MLTLSTLAIALTTHVAALQPAAPNSPQSAVAVMQLGLTAERLAAMGVTGPQTRSLLQTIDAQSAVRDEFLTSHSVLRAAEVHEARMRQRAEGFASSEFQADLRAAELAVSEAAARHAAAVSSLLQVVDHMDAVGSIRAACPPDRFEAVLPGWAQLHVDGRGTPVATALRAESRAARLQTELDRGTSEFLQRVRNDSQASASRDREETHLAAVQAVFTEALANRER